MSVRMKSRISKQRSRIKFSTPNCKEKQECSSSLKQSRRLFQEPGVLSSVVWERRSKTTGILERHSTSRPLQQVLWPPFPVSLKANGSLLAHFARVSTKGLAMAITILSLWAALPRTTSTSCRIPQLEWASCSTLSSLPPGRLVLTKWVPALLPTPQCLEHHQPHPCCAVGILKLAQYTWWEVTPPAS